MYTLQGLWTQAREKLPVTTIVLRTRYYAILLGEYRNVGANPGRTAMDMMDLGNPNIDWVRIANGMGVEAAKTATLDGLADLMRRASPEWPLPDRAGGLTAMDMGMRGQRVLVTGGSKGIGLACAEAFAAGGLRPGAGWRATRRRWRAAGRRRAGPGHRCAS
jgi:hypothetical protein